MKYVNELRERHKRFNSNWRKANPEKRRAHRAVEAALKTGTLKRPLNCQRCGKRPRKLNGHHADYSLPLQVEWLCGMCHLAEHRVHI